MQFDEIYVFREKYWLGKLEINIEFFEKLLYFAVWILNGLEVCLGDS